MTNLPDPLTSSVHKKGQNGWRGERASSSLMSIEEPELTGEKFSLIIIKKAHRMGRREISCFLQIAFGCCRIWCI